MAKRATTAFCAALLAAAWCVPCAAQGTVYESKDKSGPVFSDQPSPGAKPMDLPPPNVIQTPPLPQRKPASAAAAPAYSSLSISSLENEGTVHTNTGDFQVLVRSVPSLRAAAGDRILVTLDGTQLQRKYSTGAVNIHAEDWPAAASGDAKHSLKVAIVGPTGATLIESAPITFYARRATVSKDGGKVEVTPHRRR